MSCTSTTSCEKAVRNSVVAISSAAAISRGQIVSIARRAIVRSPEHDPEKWVPVFGKRSCSINMTRDSEGAVAVDGHAGATTDHGGRRVFLDQRWAVERHAGSQQITLI